MSQSVLGEVFTPAEVARAAGVALRDVRALIDAGEFAPVAGTSYIAGRDALRAGRRLYAATAGVSAARHELFDGPPSRTLQTRRAGLPAFASSALHASIVALVFWLSAAAAGIEAVDEAPRSTGRLVFIMSPGPGGGGGGGGLRNPLPAPKIRRRGTERERIAVPAVTVKPVVAEKREVETPKPTPPPAPTPVERPPDRAPAPLLAAPVVAAAPDPAERDGNAVF